MGKSLTQKIIASHYVSGSMMPREEVFIKAAEFTKIGSSYTYSKYTLTELILKYREKYPRTEFEIINDQSNLLFRKVLEGSADVAFVQGDYEGEVRQVLIGQTQGYAVSKEQISLDDLPDLPRIDYKTNDRTKALLSEWWLVKRDGSRGIRNTWFVYPKEKRIPKALECFIRYIERGAVKKQLLCRRNTKNIEMSVHL